MKFKFRIEGLFMGLRFTFHVQLNGINLGWHPSFPPGLHLFMGLSLENAGISSCHPGAHSACTASTGTRGNFVASAMNEMKS